MKLAIIYARYSPRPKRPTATGRELAFDSCDMQTDLCKAYCKAMMLHPVGVYSDREKSGGDTLNRPGWHEAFAHAKRDKATIVVYSLSRIIRNTELACAIERELRTAGGALASLHEHIDTSTPIGRYIFRLLVSTDEFERERIAERTSDSHKIRQARGGRVSARPPFGWKDDPASPTVQTEKCGLRHTGLIPDPAEQETLALIVKLHADGLSDSVIARKLERDGVPSRSGRSGRKAWHHNTIRKIVALAEARATTGRPI